MQTKTFEMWLQTSIVSGVRDRERVQIRHGFTILSIDNRVALTDPGGVKTWEVQLNPYFSITARKHDTALHLAHKMSDMDTGGLPG